MTGGESGSDEARWDERYRQSTRLWSGEPNPQLVAETADMPTGRALDAGCGEGADAIWLAEHGWRVTALDLSTVALERAKAQATNLAPDIAARISWQHADLRDWSTGQATFDLVTAQFLHLPPHQRRDVHRRLAAAVAPGGILLIVGHHPSDVDTGVPRPPLEVLATSSEMAESLRPGAWTIVVDEARPRSVTGSDGSMVTVHDAVLKARREI